MAERHRADERAKAEAAGAPGKIGERDPRLERVALGAAHQREEMVRPPQRLEAELLHAPRVPAPASPVQPLLPFEHDAEVHVPPSFRAARALRRFSILLRRARSVTKNACEHS